MDESQLPTQPTNNEEGLQPMPPLDSDLQTPNTPLAQTPDTSDNTAPEATPTLPTDDSIVPAPGESIVESLDPAPVSDESPLTTPGLEPVDGSTNTQQEPPVTDAFVPSAPEVPTADTTVSPPVEVSPVDPALQDQTLANEAPLSDTTAETPSAPGDQLA